MVEGGIVEADSPGGGNIKVMEPLVMTATPVDPAISILTLLLQSSFSL